MENNKENINSILFQSYYSPNSPAGFSSAERLYRYVKSVHKLRVTKKYIEKWLQKQQTFTLHKDRRIQFARNHYNVTNIDDLWEMDLIDMQKCSRTNGGNKYILAVIDCFSRFAWCIPIKRKTPDEILNAFNILFASTSRKPIKIQSDKGREFVNKNVKAYFHEKGIQFFTTRDPSTKAAICERFIRTIKGIIYKYFTHSKSTRYVEILKSITFLYNNRVHSSIGIAPCDVNDSNTLAVWEYMNKKRERIKKKPTLNVGDTVRVSNPKTVFEKGYKPKWSEELFSIEQVMLRDPVVYKIKDSNGVIINANFFEQELQKVIAQ